jgi:hypothetical protein
VDPENWPLDAESVAERTREVIRAVDSASDDDRLTLLSDLLCTAWGTVTAQNQ